MKYTVPDYYQEFECIAGDCPATCCAGWQIMIDERSLKRYKNYKGPFGSRLANSIDWKEGTFLQYNGRCAFLDENNLCDIYSEAGPKLFCRTCRNYPRHIEEFENEREISLSLSCPVAAELILGRKEKVRFVSAEKDVREEEDETFDFFLYSALQDCRSVMIDILQDRNEPVSFRMAKVLALAHDVQNRMDARRIFEVETLLERYQREGADEKLRGRFHSFMQQKLKEEAAADDSGRNANGGDGNCGSRMKYGRDLVGLLDELEVLDPSWPVQIESYRKVLYENGTVRYQQAVNTAEALYQNWKKSAEDALEEYGGGKGHSAVFELEMEQLMVYFIFTYFCGAVYDGDALAKVKMAVACTLILRELWIADCTLLDGMADGEREKAYAGAKDTDKESEAADGEREKGHGCVNRTEYDMARNRTAWRFSRELEHSDPNLDKMEEMMNERGEASFETLLAMILSV